MNAERICEWVFTLGVCLCALIVAVALVLIIALIVNPHMFDSTVTICTGTAQQCR